MSGRPSPTGDDSRVRPRPAAARHLYTALMHLVVPYALLRLLWRARRNRAYLERWGERFGCGPPVPGDGDVFWIHAVSVGEAQAAVPVVRALHERYPDARVLMTTTTPTGAERVRQAFGDTVIHRYMPYDLPGVVTRFLDRVRPRLAMFVETELWPNMFHQCARRGIPVMVANARLSARSAAAYGRFAAVTREMLGTVGAIAAQGEADAQRLVALGASAARTRVTGSVKFDVRLPASLHEQAAVLRRCWGVDRGVWIAASTHEGEDEQVLDAFEGVRRQVPDCLLVLVPRHPERFARVAALCRRRGLRTVSRSEEPADCSGVQVFVGDTMGELPLFYAAADVAFVGGSLVEVGGHNMLEPAALGLPVLTGPHLFNFAEISERLFEVQAASLVEGAGALGEAVVPLLADANLRHATGERGRAFVDANRGALDRIVDMVAELLQETGPRA